MQEGEMFLHLSSYANNSGSCVPPVEVHAASRNDAVMQMVSISLHITTPAPVAAAPYRAYRRPRSKDAYSVDFKSPVPITRQEPKQILMSIAQLLLLGDSMSGLSRRAMKPTTRNALRGSKCSSKLRGDMWQR
jgi:hypothetical protein